MDTTSLLGAAIKYMEYLHQRVRTLEEQAANQAAESVEKSGTTVEDGGSDEQISPEIKARICNKTILVKIQCGKRKGLVVEILGELEKLNLSLVNMSVAPFGSLAFDITIVAKMENEFSLSTTDVVAALDSTLQVQNEQSCTQKLHCHDGI